LFGVRVLIPYAPEVGILRFFSPGALAVFPMLEMLPLAVFLLRCKLPLFSLQ
jgi:hypothetical protein